MDQHELNERDDQWEAISVETHFLSVLRAMLSGTQQAQAEALARVPEELRSRVGQWRDDEGNTLLMLAARRGCCNMARAAIDWGADVGAKNEQGRCALYSACEKDGNLELVDLLLNAGACPDVSMHEMGSTALMRAMLLDSDDIALRLLEAGADPWLSSSSYGDKNLSTAIDYMFSFDVVAVFALLHRRGAFNEMPVHPLYVAAKNHAVEIVEFCLDDPVLKLPALNDPWDVLQDACFFDSMRDRIMACRSAHVIEAGVIAEGGVGSAPARSREGVSL